MKIASVLLIVCYAPVFGQQDPIDSLKRVLEGELADSMEISTMNELSLSYLYSESYDEFFDYSRQAQALAEKSNYLPGLALSHKNQGLAYYFQGDYLEALDSWTSALETYRVIPDSVGVANILNNLGAIYYTQGNTVRALENYLQSLSVAENLGEPVRIASALVNIAGLYGETGDYEKGLDYYKQLEPYIPIADDVGIEVSYLMGMGEISYKQGNLEDASVYFQKSLPLNENTPDYSYNLLMLARVENAGGNTSASIEYLNNALDNSRRNNYQLDEVESLMLLGEVLSSDNPDKSLEFLFEAEGKARNIGLETQLRDIYKSVSNIYSSRGDFREAYRYQTLYLTKKDSLFNVATDDKIRGLQFDFDLQKKQDEITLLQNNAEIAELQQKRQRAITWGVGVSSVVLLLLIIGLYNRYKYIRRTNKIIEAQTARSENLLLNILPEETAQELKENGRVAAKKYDLVSVMFTDFKGFTEFSKNLTPEELVKSIDFFFSKFDEVVESYDLEKIKTIGDAYMCAGGLPDEDPEHPKRLIQAAFDILEIVEDAKHNPDYEEVISFDIRIGINTGPVVAGVVGYKKFAYDIWGDTVNVASRSEGLSKPGMINITENTYQHIKDDFECEYRGEIFVKNKGMVKMYFVLGPKGNMDKGANENLKLGQESS